MDCTFITENGNFNYRVGVVIVKDGRMLMARNPIEACYYSVGGRVRFGESLVEAVIRELKEETGIDCEIGRLVCIHENFFKNVEGVFFHEFSCFFTVKPNPDLMSIPDGHRTSGGPDGEYLTWIDTENCELPVYPDFFRTSGFGIGGEVKHYITKNDEMK